MSAAPKLIPVFEEQKAPQSTAKPLLGMSLDFWMVGGGSLLAFVGFQMFSEESREPYKLSYFMYFLSMVVNWPHFMLSYQMLYKDRAKLLFKKPSYLWAGVFVPVALLGLTIWGFSRKDDIVFSCLVQIMFLTVGWHYVKQTFGAMVVTSARKGFYFQKNERRLLLTNFGALWALSFFAGHAQVREVAFFGMKYDLLGVDPLWMQASYAVFAGSLVLTIGTFLKRFIQTGQSPSGLAITAQLSLYAWYLPFATHRHFFYVIPFFHSLQYLLFTGALKKNEWKKTLGFGQNPESRAAWLKKTGSYFGSSIVLGLLVFLAIPTLLDRQMENWNPGAAEIWGPTVFMAAFQLFINIHHYFIDNVLWTKDNTEIRDHLMR